MSRRFLFRKIFLARNRDEYYVGHIRNLDKSIETKQIYKLLSGAKDESKCKISNDKSKTEQKT